MTKKLLRMVLLLIMLSLLVVENVSCTYFSPLVGKWQESQSQNTIEFTRDGKVILNSNDYLTSGNYQLVGSDVVKLNYEGLSGGMASLFGVDTWQYKISGNTMTVVAGGGTDVFYRFGSSTTTRTIQNTKTSTGIIPMTTATSQNYRVGLPTITLTYPNSGETWHVGDVVTIRWISTNLPQGSAVNVSLSLANTVIFSFCNFANWLNNKYGKFHLDSNLQFRYH